VTASLAVAVIVAVSVTVALAGALAFAPAARAQTSATLTPLLSPDRLGARGAVTLRVRFTDSDTIVPIPVRKATLRFSAGLRLEVPRLRSCRGSHLRSIGPRGCPVASALGRGRAVVEAQLGSQTMREAISLRLFLGPLHNLQPTVELYARGHTPFDKRAVLFGSVLTDTAPYGERLVLLIPPIRTMPREPDASIVTFTLRVGAADRGRRRDRNAVHVPLRCPSGGFPVTGEFVYADGSGGDAHAEIPCPGSTKEARRSAKDSSR